jgi:hypothetical protein
MAFSIEWVVVEEFRRGHLLSTTSKDFDGTRQTTQPHGPLYPMLTFILHLPNKLAQIDNKGTGLTPLHNQSEIAGLSEYHLSPPHSQADIHSPLERRPV